MRYYIKVEKNVKIYVEDLNPEYSKTILFVHGWPLNHNAYEYQLNVLSRLEYRCVAIDLRGYGKSDRPSSGYFYDTMAKDIFNVIETLKLKDVTLVGHSMGGAISIKYVSNYNSHNVSRLCLIAAAAPQWVKDKNWQYGYTGEEVDSFIEQSYNDRPKFIRSVADLFFYQYTSQPFVDWFCDLCLAASGWSTTQSLMALRDESLLNDLGNINIPTLILHGLHDKVCPFEFGQYMNQAIKNSRLVPLTESGHAAFYEQRDKVNEEIVNFINNC